MPAFALSAAAPELVHARANKEEVRPGGGEGRGRSAGSPHTHSSSGRGEGGAEVFVIAFPMAASLQPRMGALRRSEGSSWASGARRLSAGGRRPRIGLKVTRNAPRPPPPTIGLTPPLSQPIHHQLCAAAHMASPSGSGGGSAVPPMMPAPASSGDPAGSEAAWSHTVPHAVRAAPAALAARGREDGVDPSRPVPPAPPSDAWALIAGRSAPSRCVTGPAGMGVSIMIGLC